MRVHIHSTRTRPDFKFSKTEIEKHQVKPDTSSAKYKTGGLGFKKPIFTRVIDCQGFLHPLITETKEIHIGLLGGCSDNGEFCSTFPGEQMRTLRNELYSLLHTYGEMECICEGIKLETWLKAVNL